MFRHLLKRKTIVLMAGCLAITLLALSVTTQNSKADDLSGRELLSVTRVAHGGTEFAGLQYVTARAEGFVNASAFAAAGATALTSAVEVKVGITDYQDRDMRRRLDIAPMGALAQLGGGPTFLVYTGTQGGGMLLGNEIRVSEITASRHWAMMGFNTINRAIERQLITVRQPDQGSNYVVEVKFTNDDTVRYWIDKNSFLITKVVTRNKSTCDDRRGALRLSQGELYDASLPHRHTPARSAPRRPADCQLRPPDDCPRWTLHDDGHAVSAK